MSGEILLKIIQGMFGTAGWVSRLHMAFDGNKKITSVWTNWDSIKKKLKKLSDSFDCKRLLKDRKELKVLEQSIQHLKSWSEVGWIFKLHKAIKRKAAEKEKLYRERLRHRKESLFGAICGWRYSFYHIHPESKVVAFLSLTIDLLTWIYHIMI